MLLHRMVRIFSILLLLFSLSVSCSKNRQLPNTPTLFTKLESNETGINFKNTINNQKEFNIFTYRNFYNGGGVAIGDINNDGLPDIFFTANLDPNKLYLNKGNFKFEDISNKARVNGNNTWSTGVVMVDINADGLLDIYVCNAGNIKGDNLKNELFINNGNLTFTEKAEEYNLADSGLTTHAAFFDYDADGDLDAYILNNSFIPVNSLNYSNKRELRDKDWNVPSILKGGGDKLLRNDNGYFIDVSKEAGIFGSLIGFGLGVNIGDVNLDGYLDIYVSNDFYERDYLYINNKNGSFTESIKEWTSHISQSSMGADFGDINNDGNLDIFVTDMLPEEDKRLKETTQFESYDVYQRKLGLDFYHQYMQNTLQLNMGNNQFSEIANLSGISNTDWSWGALLFDMDNDGYKDILVCNGIYNDLTNQDFMNFFANDIIQNMVVNGKKEEVEQIVNKMPSTPISNYAFKNNKNLKFNNQSKQWGLDTPSFSNGASYADLDNDGDLDIVINNVNQEAFIYKNNTNALTKNNFIKITLKGNSPNTFAIGSKINAYSKNEIISYEVMPSRGFQSSVDYVQTIGIGDKTIDSLKVFWSNNSSQTIKNIKPNQSYSFNQIDAIPLNNNTLKNTSKFLTEIQSTFESHQENKYIDFNYEGLIQEMLSKEGPTISVADFNNDALEDVFVGGTKEQAAKVYIQTSTGNFKQQSNANFEKNNYFEDTASAIFDADLDGDLDIILGAGGNEVGNDKHYKTRLYINGGKGQFSLKEASIPITQNNTAVIAPFDFDNDGDMDVFVGSRSVPGVYGINAKHQLLENDGKGNFKDITESKAYNFKDLGMVTDAVWEDMDGDTIKDLVVSIDCGAPTIFKNSGRRLSIMPTNLSNHKGWWNVVKAKDLNNDGKIDLIIGNKGLNMVYKPKKDAPLKMFINDFDNNGTIEQIVTQTLNGKDVPINIKNELTSQIVSLKKQNLKYATYATKSIQELLSKEVIAQSIIREINTSESLVAINKGHGNFEIKTLPIQAQFSSIDAIVIADINKDSHLDLLLGGNKYGFKPQFARLDANFGSLLLGDGNANFKWVDYSKSGFFVKGEIKNISTVKAKNNTHFVMGINNQQPKIFKLNHE